jgi:hypothetical protein
MMAPVLADVDWVATATVATAAATLVLAIATFGAVRSANRAASAAEQSLAAQLWPLLAQARPEDPEQKVVFRDRHKLVVPGGQGLAEATADAVYFAIPVRNVGPGLAVLDRWSFAAGHREAADIHEDQATFRRLTIDLYIPPGEVGYWLGTIRDPSDPAFAAASRAIDDHGEMTLDLLYSDHLGHQRTISRFALMPTPDGRWVARASRHFSLDGPAPR